MSLAANAEAPKRFTGALWTNRQTSVSCPRTTAPVSHPHQHLRPTIMFEAC